MGYFVFAVAVACELDELRNGLAGARACLGVAP